ncbi:MAG: hypothetical protein VW102_01370 [Poseidonia sp.]
MRQRPHIGLLVVFLFLAPAWSVMLAQAQGGTVSTFSDGTASHTVTVSGGQHGTVGFELQRNTTVTSASFFIRPDSNGPSPGSVDLDINNDGLYEWEFSQPGYGMFGQQNVFENGTASESVFIDPSDVNTSTPLSPTFLLPNGASLSSSSMEVTFAPNLTGGFFDTGFVHDLSIGDVTGDGNDDVVLYSQTANMTVNTNGTANATNWTVAPAFRVLTYDNASGVQLSSWTPTCANITNTMTADLNGDGYDDVVHHVPSSRTLCMHFVNTTTGVGFEPPINVSLASSVRDFAFIDFTGNGVDEMVSVRTNGVVSVDEYRNRTNSFTNRGAETVLQSGSQTAANLTHLLVDYFNGTNNLPILLAVDAGNDGTEVYWSSSLGDVVVSTRRATGVSSDALVGDFDGDGDLDILASRFNGHRSIEKQGNGNWNGDNHNIMVDLTNATILDYNLDSDVELLVPNAGNPDGNTVTMDGNLSVHSFESGGWGWGSYDNRVSSQTTAVIEPWTSPRAIYTADLDGDGFIEHVVLAGEGNQHGVFVSAWHQVGYDIDQNGDADVESQGYAGNGSNGLAPLSVVDTNGSLTGSLNTLLPGMPYQADAYGIQMSAVQFTTHSLTAGQVEFSNLNFVYSADFLVNTNPHITGNLSNALNQQMTGGTGTLTVPFTFHTSQNGSFVLHSPTVNYQDGAPNIALPPTPVLSLVELTPDRVMFEWQNVTDFGDDVLNFMVYREATGQSVNTQNAYDTTVANNSLDFNVQPGQSWTYWVRSVHDFGVTSNLSLPLEVEIPYPLPKSFVPDVVAVDAPDDNGGALNLTWGQGDASIETHRVYVSSSNFTSIAGMNTSITANATTFALQVRAESNGTTLVDGTPYFVAVVGFDQYGNASDNVTAFGPVYSRNNTALETQLDVTYTPFAEEASIGDLLLARDEGLVMDAYLHQDGAPVAGRTVTLFIVGEAEQYSISATTDDAGHAHLDITKLSDLGPLDATGPMELKAVFTGYSADPTKQPLMGASNVTSAFGTIPLEIDGDDLIMLDEDDGFETVFEVSTDDMMHQTAIANVGMYWEAVTSDGKTADSGVGEVRGNEMTITGTGAYDGTLTLYLDADPPVYYIPGMSLTVDFEASPEVENNETNTTETNQTNTSTFPDVTLPPTVTCGTVTYGWEDVADDVTMTCTVTNPNPFDVLVDFAWKVIPNTPPAIDITYDDAGLSVTVEANGAVDLTLLVVRNGPTQGMYPGEQGKGYIITITCLELDGANACGDMTGATASYQGELVWTLGEMPIVDDGNTNTVQDETSSAMTPVVVGLGVLIAILVAIGGVLYMRRNGEAEFDDDDDEDYYDMAADETPVTRADTLDLDESKSLDELKEEGKDLHEAAPEGLASSPTLGSSADAFEFGATAEDQHLLELNEDAGEEDDESAEGTEGEDDGITVDENGTEWWEDEDGVWWYREEGWDDWAVWED